MPLTLRGTAGGKAAFKSQKPGTSASWVQAACLNSVLVSEMESWCDVDPWSGLPSVLALPFQPSSSLWASLCARPAAPHTAGSAGSWETVASETESRRPVSQAESASALTLPFTQCLGSPSFFL